MMEVPLLISSQLEFAARFHSEVEIVTRTCEGPIVRATFGQMHKRVLQLARALQKLGVKTGDRVATIAFNSQRHLELYFAVSGMGAILHTINPRLPVDQLQFIVGHAEDSVLFFDAPFAKLAQLAGVSKSFSLDHVYEELIAPERAEFTWPLFDENTASSLCYTSGTAGAPKGVLYSHRSTVLHSYAIATADGLAISGADVTLPVVPMFHVNAWGVPYAAVMTGSKLVMPGPGLDGASLTQLIESEQVTSLLGVPTVWLGLLNHLKSANKILKTVKTVVIGGSACPPSMIEAFEQHGARVIHAWGMTEMSPLGTACSLLPKHAGLSSAEKLKIQSKQGRPIFGVDLRLVDDNGQIVAHDGLTSGHLQVRGPWVIERYFKEAHSACEGGWFGTGDIASIDSDGYMHITDRSKDVIKSGGEWISSIALENEAQRFAGVAQAAAIGLPHPKWTERPLLLIVQAPGAAVDLVALKEHLAKHLAKWWLPDAIEFIEALPVGATGKVLKRKLRETYAAFVWP
jgi:3-(methylthio)propionyl---CoA ligase